MQTRPDQPTLLEAVAGFLLEQVAPALEADKALQFRVLIAANLASVVAGELRTGDARLAQEVARLGRLLPQLPSSLEGRTTPERRALLEALDRALASRLRAGTLSADEQREALEHLLATARETLEVTNPRFDVSDDV